MAYSWVILTDIFTADHFFPAWNLIWKSIPFFTKIWTVSKASILIQRLTLFFLLVQVSVFSLSDILCLWPFVQVRSTSPLSSMMLTSLPVSVRVVPFTLLPWFLTDLLSQLQVTRLKMTARLLQLLVRVTAWRIRQLFRIRWDMWHFPNLFFAVQPWRPSGLPIAWSACSH